MHVIIVGGGLGGTAAALALHRQGISVTLLEQNPVLGTLRSGIRMGPNAVHILQQLGVFDALSLKAVTPQSFRVCDFDNGEQIYDHVLGETFVEQYGQKIITLSAQDLLDSISRSLPPHIVRTNCQCTYVHQSQDCAYATLATGEIVTGDVIIAADGAHSIVNRTLWGQRQPWYSSIVCWRACIEGTSLAALNLEERFYHWHGCGRFADGYWIRPQKQFQLDAFFTHHEWTQERAPAEGNISQFLSAMAGCEPRLQGLVDLATELITTPLHYRKPAKQWTVGRISLLGDAAHQILPLMGWGPMTCIEDALVLSLCLARANSGPLTASQALLDYEARRLPRTTALQCRALALRSLLMTPDASSRNRVVLGLHSQDRIDPKAQSQWAWIYNYEPQEEVQTALSYGSAMPFSRAKQQLVWPHSKPQHRWQNVFNFDDLALGLEGQRLAWDRAFGSKVLAREIKFAGVSCLQCDPTPVRHSDDRVVLHLHGGGFIMGSARSALDQAMIIGSHAKAKVLCVEYRLAPEYPFPAPIQDLIAVFRALRQEGIEANNIFLSGEGAGAAICLSALMILRDESDLLPGAFVGVSPFADLTLDSESMQLYGFSDEWLNRDTYTQMASFYLQGTHAQNEHASPVFGRFEGLCPMLLIAGLQEALYSDALRIAKKANAAGGYAQLFLAKTPTHAFTQFMHERASKAALELMARFISRIHALCTSHPTQVIHSGDNDLIEQL